MIGLTMTALMPRGIADGQLIKSKTITVGAVFGLVIMGARKILCNGAKN